MIITDDHQLMALDLPAQQYTVFNTDAGIDKISNLEHPYVFFKPILNSNRLLLPWVENGKIIQSYDLQEGEITDRFIDIEDILQTDQEFERTLLRTNTGSLLALSNDQIVFTPTHYNGVVHLYENTEDQWIAGENIYGYRKIDQTFTTHETVNEPHSRTQTIIPQDNSIIGIELHSWSMGLFALKDGKFAHLSLTNIGLDDDQMNLVIEIFDFEEKELERFIITNQFSLTYRPDQIPVWMDRDGYLYIADMRGEPALRKLELIW